MRTLPKKGETVKWNTPQGETLGTVEKTLTGTTQIKGHTAKATREHPQVLVRSRTSGKKAAHKPEGLQKA
jgi:hypothetical protein